MSSPHRLEVVPDPPAGSVAEALTPLLRALFHGQIPIHVVAWDGSAVGPPSGPTVIVHSPMALRRMLWAPGELGIGRAHVAGDLELQGSVFELLELREALDARKGDATLDLQARDLLTLVRVAQRLGALGLPPSPPPEEARLRGSRHGLHRDATAIAHHYDVGNDFYRLVLGPSLTYSCGYWADGINDLNDAQTAKYELISRKLDLQPGQRLLDVGCGWGGMVLHAASHHGVQAVGITLSREQARLARERVAEAGLGEQIEIRVQDYREVDDGPFDAISSIGMFEHVGLERMQEYLRDLHDLLRPEGRLLNHAISRPRPTEHPAIGRRSFMARYVFPDAALLEVGRVVTAMQHNGLEVRDVESLREHYARTLRAWVANLEANWDRAQRLVGPGRARVWRLYMAGSALGFEQNRLAIHQVLAVRAAADGRSGMPATRARLDLERPLPTRAEGRSN